MVTSQVTSHIGDESIDLAVVWIAIRRRKWQVLGVALLFITASVAYAFGSTPWYRAQTVLAPVADGGLRPDIGGALGGLAGLSGLTLGRSATVENLAVLKSDDLAREFIEEEGLLPVLFASQWDTEHGRWRVEPGQQEPDVRDAVALFDMAVRKVSEDKKSGLVTVSISWTDPKLASEWASKFVRLANEKVRMAAEREAERNIQYLRKELNTTGLVAIEQSLSRLLESEIQKAMLSRGNPEFAFRTIDPAVTPKLRFKPKRKVIVALGTLGGVAAGIGWALLMGARPRANRRRAAD